jgi:hypothetical protein
MFLIGHNENELSLDHGRGVVGREQPSSSNLPQCLCNRPAFQCHHNDPGFHSSLHSHNSYSGQNSIYEANSASATVDYPRRFHPKYRPSMSMKISWSCRSVPHSTVIPFKPCAFVLECLPQFQFSSFLLRVDQPTAKRVRLRSRTHR